MNKYRNEMQMNKLVLMFRCVKMSHVAAEANLYFIRKWDYYFGIWQVFVCIRSNLHV